MKLDRSHPDFVPYYHGSQRRKNAAGWVVAENGCHIWVGARDTNGYGQARVDGRLQMVHRVRYQREVGPVAADMDLDHYFCNNGPGGCCNPLHVRPASRRENALRGDGASSLHAAKTHCVNGHILDGDNLLASDLQKGRRTCRVCHNARNRAFRQRHDSPERKAQEAARVRARRARS